MTTSTPQGTPTEARAMHLTLLPGAAVRLIQLSDGPGPWAGCWDLPEAAQTPAPHASVGPVATPGWAPRAAAHMLHITVTADASHAAPAAGMWVPIERALAEHTRWARPLAPRARAALMAARQSLAESATLPQAVAERVAAHLHALAGAPLPAYDLHDHVRAVPVRSPTLAPATHTNCYLLGHKQLTVVDPGTPYPEEQQAFVAYLEALENQGARFEGIWITHHHIDHIGAAMRVRERFSTPIFAHAETAAALRGVVTVDHLIGDNDLLQVEGTAYRALFTPGHAQGHVAFYAPGHKLLLSGDNVLGSGTPIVPPAPHGSMADYIAGLRRLAALDLSWVLPGHGTPSVRGAARVQETLDARLSREQGVLDALDKLGGSATAERLVQHVYRGLGAQVHKLALLSTRAHLEKLLDEGRVALRPGPPASSPVYRRTIAGAPPFG